MSPKSGNRFGGQRHAENNTKARRLSLLERDAP